MADESAASAHPHPLTSQVGGHTGIQISDDGALLIKPALPHELQFYQDSLTDPALAPLRQWVPTYLGTLRLEGQNTADGLANVEGIPEGEKDECSAIRSHCTQCDNCSEIYSYWLLRTLHTDSSSRISSTSSLARFYTMRMHRRKKRNGCRTPRGIQLPGKRGFV